MGGEKIKINTEQRPAVDEKKRSKSGKNKTAVEITNRKKGVRSQREGRKAKGEGEAALPPHPINQKVGSGGGSVREEGGNGRGKGKRGKGKRGETGKRICK